MLKAQWMAIRAGFAALCGCAVTGALAGGTVPVEWNVTPLKSGAYIETFATVPEWATAVGSSTQAVKSAVATVSYSRVNDWFDNATTALALDTEGEDINNHLSEDSVYQITVSVLFVRYITERPPSVVTVVGSF